VTFRLVEDPDGVGVLAERVATEINRPVAHVEKDFWVTEVLRGVNAAAAALGIEILFKGGTSLSKVYRLIERFSEDVDILVVLPPGTKGTHDRILKELVAGAEAATGLTAVVDPATATKGVKRSARFIYREGSDAGNAGLSEGVLLEIGTRDGALGAATAPVRSLIVEHAGDDVAEAAEADPVTVRVMAPWRTLVEKLILVHTAHSTEDQADAVRGARHYYDIHQLLTSAEVRSGIAEVGIAAIARDVCTYSRLAELPFNERPASGFHTSPAFTGGPHTDAARQEYLGRVVAQLLWPGKHHPSFDECVAAVQTYGDLL
jgi:hypothetical protein